MDKKLFCFGEYYSDGIYTDIKKSMITLARYKFASKMLEYKKDFRILELGCNEGVGTFFFTQMPNCVEYVGVDINREAIKWGTNNIKPNAEQLGKKVSFLEADFLGGELGGGYDAVVSLDVIEHIQKSDEKKYMKTIIKNLKNDGVAIIGTPNIKMCQYQSEETKKVHVNMFEQKRLYSLLNTVFYNVFLFSMNDEVIHTGFAPMSCYYFALCCGPHL